VPFLYYLAFLAVVAAAFAGNAVLRTDTPTTANAGMVHAAADITPLEKLHREIAGRRGVAAQPPHDSQVTTLTSLPVTLQTDSGVQTSSAVAVDHAPTTPIVEPAPKASPRKGHRRQANSKKCPPGQCAPKDVRTVWSLNDHAP
jgi:hypothetical protein